MGTVAEIEEAVGTARDGGCDQLVLLHCVSAYPASPEDACLANIAELARRFNVPVGLSDHTMGTAVSVAAVAMGAVAIEKHFTLSRADGGVDSAFSLEPEELNRLVVDAKVAALARGGPDIGPKGTEEGSRKYRRSLYVVADIPAGDEFTEMNIRSIRPGLGLPPKHYKALLGLRASRDLKRGEAMEWGMVEGGE